MIRGFHEYRQSWQPVVGENLILKNEPTNEKDRLAVFVKKEQEVVGHVPRNLATIFHHFLNRELNNGFVEVTAMPVNRGAGMGMEVPYIFRLYGPRKYWRRLEDLIKMELQSVSVREHI